MRMNLETALTEAAESNNVEVAAPVVQDLSNKTRIGVTSKRALMAGLAANIVNFMGRYFDKFEAYTSKNGFKDLDVITNSLKKSSARFERPVMNAKWRDLSGKDILDEIVYFNITVQQLQRAYSALIKLNPKEYSALPEDKKKYMSDFVTAISTVESAKFSVMSILRKYVK